MNKGCNFSLQKVLILHNNFREIVWMETTILKNRLLHDS
jgi:hypothetical protein